MWLRRVKQSTGSRPLSLMFAPTIQHLIIHDIIKRELKKIRPLVMMQISNTALKKLLPSCTYIYYYEFICEYLVFSKIIENFRNLPYPKIRYKYLWPYNYCPISILISLRKFVEREIRAQLQNCIQQHNILTPDHFVFPPNHSTQHQLLRVMFSVKIST